VVRDALLVAIARDLLLIRLRGLSWTDPPREAPGLTAWGSDSDQGGTCGVPAHQRRHWSDAHM